MRRGNDTRSFSVLFVDDEEKAQKYFRLAYANDFPVLTAGSVSVALEVLAQRADEIAVLITDQRMPGQQGVDLLKLAREQWPAIVRILTTAYSDLDDAIAAVNRGEILRYITKPWDISALRVDLRHAMDFFLLRRERDLLMAEKFSVRRSMVHSDRLRALLAIAAGFKQLRHSPQAVAAWLRDSLDSASAVQPAPASMELWGLEVRETMDLMRVHRRLRALDDSVSPGYPDRADLSELLRDTGLAVEGSARQVSIRRDLVGSMLGTLAQLVGGSAAARLEESVEPTGNKTLRISVTGSGMASSPFTGRLGGDGSDVGLLVSYLVAWHHGGTLTATIAEGQGNFLLTLPQEPDDVVLPRPDEEWLAREFSMLEDWQ